MRWNDVVTLFRTVFWRIRAHEKERGRFASRGVARARALDGFVYLNRCSQNHQTVSTSVQFWVYFMDEHVQRLRDGCHGVHTRTIRYRSVHLAKSQRVSNARLSLRECHDWFVQFHFERRNHASARVLSVRVDGLAHGINTHVHQRFSEDEVKTGTEEENKLIIIECSILLLALLEEHYLYIYLL